MSKLKQCYDPNLMIEADSAIVFNNALNKNDFKALILSKKLDNLHSALLLPPSTN